MTKEVLFEALPTCSKKKCPKEWAKYEAYQIINMGDANARLRRISEGE